MTFVTNNIALDKTTEANSQITQGTLGTTLFQRSNDIASTDTSLLHKPILMDDPNKTVSIGVPQETLSIDVPHAPILTDAPKEALPLDDPNAPVFSDAPNETVLLDDPNVTLLIDGPNDGPNEKDGANERVSTFAPHSVRTRSYGRPVQQRLSP